MTVASLGGRTAPGDTLPGGDTRMRKIVGEFRKNTGQTRSKGGSCDETTAKKVISLHATTEKGRQFFSGKNRGDTVSCRPG